jgi:hypothetical protein
MYLGDYELNDYVTIPVNTHDPSDGTATDVDLGYNGGFPAYRIYEDETATAILTGSMAKLDDGNTTGFYTERIQLLVASGFEVGKSYTVYIAAQVNSILGTQSHTFRLSNALNRILGAVGGKKVVNAAGTQVQVYDRAGVLMVTLDRTGSGPYTWTPTWA